MAGYPYGHSALLHNLFGHLAINTVIVKITNSGNSVDVMVLADDDNDHQLLAGNHGFVSERLNFSGILQARLPK